MLNPVKASHISDLLTLNNAAPSRSSSEAAESSFSQQLLALLQDSMGKLGLNVELVTQVNGSSPASAEPSKGLGKCQFLVTLAATESAAQQPEIEPAVPGVIYDTHAGWSSQYYASEEMAQWLAQRFGGEVGEFASKDWSSCSTPYFPAPPPQRTIRFGDQEVNAGLLAMYFEPGRFWKPDLDAAAALYEAGILNDYVRQNWSGFISTGPAPAA